MTVDFHTHIFPDKIASATVSALAKSANIPPHSDGTEAGLLNSLCEAGVPVSVNLPVLTRPEQFESVLSFAKKINEKSYAGARIISFAGVHPRLLDPESALYRIKEEGFLGIKLHPEYQDAFIDDDSYVRILSLAKSLDLITVTHSGVDGAYRNREVRCTPTRALRMLDRIGGYEKIVFAHLGACEMLSDVYQNLAGENVYFDTAYSLHETGEEDFLRLVDKHGADRILFATDSPWRNIGEELGILRAMTSLSKTDREKILSKNALRLLGI